MSGLERQSAELRLRGSRRSRPDEIYRREVFFLRRERESSETPRAIAFCRSAAIVRLNCFAIWVAETFLRARDFSFRMSFSLHERRLIFLLAFFAIIGPCLVAGDAHMSISAAVARHCCCYVANCIMWPRVASRFCICH